MNSKHFLLQATIGVYKYVRFGVFYTKQKIKHSYTKNVEQYLNFYQPIIFSKL